MNRSNPNLLARWAQFVTRRAWWVVLFWLVAAVTIFARAPRIPTLLKDDATGFLPDDMPSRIAFDHLKKEFPNAAPASRCAVVFVRGGGLASDDEDFVGRMAEALDGKSEELGWKIHAAVLQPYLYPILTSADRKAAVVAVDLPGGALTHHSVRRVREVRKILSATPAPNGLQVEVTGGAAMGELLDANAKRDVDRTTLWAFAAVAVILLFIYRSPVAMFLPLVTIAAALMVSLGALGWAAAWGWPINGLVEMFIIVLIAGAGVDYCLFLFARFREELVETAGDANEATRRAVAHAGGAVLAGAGTVAVGLATLVLARNRDLYTSGVAIAFAVVISAAAVMSLTPAIMRLVGSRLVRLRRSDEPFPPVRDGRLWCLAADAVMKYPGSISVAMTALLVAASLVCLRVPTTYDSLDEFPPESSFVRGARLYDQHFQGGRGVTEMTLLLTHDQPLGVDRFDPLIQRLDAQLRERFPIAYVRSVHAPLNTGNEATAANSWTILLQTAVGKRMIEDAYIARDGRVARIDAGFFVEPRTAEAMDLVEKVQAAATEQLVSENIADARVLMAGEAATYLDMRDLRRRDFAVVAVAASILIYAILLALLRAPIQSAVLILATLLTYFATYGATYLIVRTALGLDGLSWQIHFLLFVIIMSLGQDYNIFVVARIHEELRTRPPNEAIAVAVRRTGKVVSSCGLIMAATFASMFSGSLLVLKQFAIALPMGILIDTFLVRPLLVPALILLLTRRRTMH